MEHAAARQATPAGGPGDADGQAFLFVQTFRAGTLAPHPTEPDAYALTLTGGAEETVYFSDRPARIVGTVATTRFIDALGFTPENPPNAALVAQTPQGEEIVVVELRDPVYNEGSDGKVTLVYDARLLASYAGAGLAHLAAGGDGDGTVPESFGTAALFIDDCSASPPVECCIGDTCYGTLGSLPRCWEEESESCVSCTPCLRLLDQCNSRFPDCDGLCLLSPVMDCPFEEAGA